MYGGNGMVLGTIIKHLNTKMHTFLKLSAPESESQCVSSHNDSCILRKEGCLCNT